MPEAEHIKTLIRPDDTLLRAIETIDTSRMQIALVVDEMDHLKGTVTDGDIRRGILGGVGLDQSVDQVMRKNPVTAQPGSSPEELLALMTSHSIKQVPLVDNDGCVIGLERLDNLFRSSSGKDNPVLVLAGGQGIRLETLTVHTPKPLLKVGDRPVLELILQQLRAYGFHRFFISVNYLAHQIEEYFGDGGSLGVSIQYLREEEPLGTAGPMALIPKPLEQPCLVVNGDLLTRVNFEKMLDHHLHSKHDMTLGIKEHRVQVPYGVVGAEGDKVVNFREKPSETHLINTGVYILDPSVVDSVVKDTFLNMNELIEQTIADANTSVGSFLINEYWMDIGTAPDYQQAQLDYSLHFPK